MGRPVGTGPGCVKRETASPLGTGDLLKRFCRIVERDADFPLGAYRGLVTGSTHAQCWAHARRKIFDARDIEPAQADQALHAIAALYKVEQQIRDDGLAGQAKLVRRQGQSKPVLERFFAWIDKQGFLPSNPFLGALAYIRERRVGLSIYLDDPELSIDTNHLERALRVIPMGKKNWLFSWTELARSMSALCKACWRPVGCTTSIRMTTSSMCCSADELLAHAPRERPGKLVSVFTEMFKARPIGHDSTLNPFVTPAAPAWDAVHRHDSLHK